MLYYLNPVLPNSISFAKSILNIKSYFYRILENVSKATEKSLNVFQWEVGCRQLITSPWRLCHLLGSCRNRFLTLLMWHIADVEMQQAFYIFCKVHWISDQQKVLLILFHLIFVIFKHNIIVLCFFLYILALMWSHK